MIKKIVTHSAFIKAKKVIDSCNNINQLHIACRFAEQACLKIKNDIMNTGITEDSTATFTAIRAYDMATGYLNDIAVEKKRKLNKELYNIS